MAVPPPLPGKSEAAPPPVEAKNPPHGRKFPCRQCGAKLDFDPEARGLKCPYCGFTEVIPDADDDKKATIREHELDAFLEEHEDKAEATVSDRYSQVTCTGCGAIVVIQDKRATDKCPYCSTNLDNKPEQVRDLIAPESVLPFAVSDRAARDRFNNWIASLWFAPTELKQLANLGQFGTVYTPFWTYDAMTYTRYTGQRGDDYWDTEYYTDANGKSQSRQVRRTRWYPASGEVRHFFDDVLIKAARSLPAHLVDRLQPWRLDELEPFREEFLSGHLTERYCVSLKDGFQEAKGVMENTIIGLIHRDIGGDHQRIEWKRTNYVGVTFKHTLLPVWVANYRYRERLFQVLVNGRSGKVAGDRPWSWWKITRLIVLILFAILLAFVLVRKATGHSVEPAHKDHSKPVRVSQTDGDLRSLEFCAADRWSAADCIKWEDVRPPGVTRKTQSAGQSFTTRTSRPGIVECPELLRCSPLIEKRKMTAIVVASRSIWVDRT